MEDCYYNLTKQKTLFTTIGKGEGPWGTIII